MIIETKNAGFKFLKENASIFLCICTKITLKCKKVISVLGWAFSNALLEFKFCLKIFSYKWDGGWWGLEV